MNASNTYKRKFIIFNNYSEKNIKGVKGYGKLEIREGKGKLEVNIEGLKPYYTEDKVGKIYLIPKEDPRDIFDCGFMEIDTKGKGRFKKEFIGGKERPIEDFSLILFELLDLSTEDNKTIKMVGKIEDMSIDIEKTLRNLDKKEQPMQKSNEYDNQEEVEYNEDENEDEYVTEEIETKDEEETKIENKKEIELEEKEKEEILDSISPIEEEKEEQYNESKELVDEDDIYQGYNEEDKEMETEEIEYHSDVESIDDLSNEIGTTDDAINEDENTDTNKNEDKEVYRNVNANYEYNRDKYYGQSIRANNKHFNVTMNYNSQVAQYTYNILRYFPEVQPFENQLEGYRWWEIGYDERNVQRGFLPFYNYVVNMYYPYSLTSKIPTCQRMMTKYGHYIFGIYDGEDEVRYYVYGVPGKFNIGEQPFRGTTGFVTWLQSKEDKNLGYWLLHVDSLMGRVVNPLRPTYPR